MLVHTACYWAHCNCDLCSCSGHYACGTTTRGSWFHQDPMPESLHSLKYTPQNRFNGNFPHESGLAASTSLSYLFSRYRDGACNTIDENYSIFSQIRKRWLPSARHVTSKTLLQRNPPVLNLVCWLTHNVNVNVNTNFYSALVACESEALQ